MKLKFLIFFFCSFLHAMEQPGHWKQKPAHKNNAVEQEKLDEEILKLSASENISLQELHDLLARGANPDFVLSHVINTLVELASNLYTEKSSRPKKVAPQLDAHTRQVVRSLILHGATVPKNHFATPYIIKLLNESHAF